MPVAQQNALVQKYCEVCHDDVYRNGGLSLQHYDAAHADPSDSAMMLAKLQTGAIGASGKPIPDQATIAAWIEATKAQAAGADKWLIAQSQSSSAKPPVFTTSIVQSVTPVQSAGPAASPQVPDLWRLTVSCRTDTREGEIELLWSPGGPDEGQEVSASIDGHNSVQFRVDGKEKMGTGGMTGPGSIALFETQAKSGANSESVEMALPARTLAISNLPHDERVNFPFADLSPSARQSLSLCFSTSNPAH